jgi:hypothetical protein
VSRKHIAEDICPYTCILEGCTKEDMFYTTKEAWKTHLVEDHRSTEYWVCFPCGGGVQLPTEAAFIAHTKQEHLETILEDQIPLLAPMSKRLIPTDITACSLCNAWPPKELGGVDREALINHIAEEVHAFSLRALPWPPDDDEAGSEEWGSDAMQTVQDWLMRWDLTYPDATERPPYNRQQKTHDPSHYFRSHPYFAENCGDDSSSRGDSDDSAASHLRSLQSEVSLTFTDSEESNLAWEVKIYLPLLIDQLEDDGVRESGIDGKLFVPLDYLERIINEENIKIELGMTDGAGTKARKPSDLPDRITKEAKRIFGALVLMDKANAIEGLLDEGLTDDHLPLSRDPKYDAVLSRDGATSF